MRKCVLVCLSTPCVRLLCCLRERGGEDEKLPLGAIVHRLVGPHKRVLESADLSQCRQGAQHVAENITRVSHRKTTQPKKQKRLTKQNDVKDETPFAP